MPALLSEDASQLIAQEVIAMARELAQSMIVTQPQTVENKPISSGYLNQMKAQKYVGSKRALEKLEQNGLSRYVIDGTIRYKVKDIDEIMDIFKV